MKKLMTSIVAALLVCAGAFAQEEKTYTATDWIGDCYVGVAGGGLTSFSKDCSPRLAPELEANVLLWLTPAVGLRAVYQGQWGKEYINGAYNPYQINHSALPFDSDYGGPGTLSYGLFYIHGDLLLNVTNFIGGYDEDRLFECSPYVNLGYLRLYDNEGGPGYDREIGVGVGLYNTFRVSDRVRITVDLRHTNIASSYKTKEAVRTNILTVSFGVAFNIFSAR